VLVKNELSKTFPVVFHSPDLNKAWHMLESRFFSVNHASAFLPEGMSIITWNNLEKSFLERSLEAIKIPYILKGEGIKKWNNLMKFGLTLEAISSSDSEYFMGLDSHDVIFAGEPSEALSRFKSLGCELLFNGEMRFYPDMPIGYYQKNKAFQDHVGKSSIFKYLNSGAWIGKRDFCLTFFKECMDIKVWEIFDCSGQEKLYSCDQSAVHEMFRKHSPKVKIDYGSEVFCNMAFFKECDISFPKKLHY